MEINSLNSARVIKKSENAGQNLAITGATTALGAGVGAAIASKKFASPTIDEYVTSRIEANMDKVQSSLKHSKWPKAFARISEKAKADYPKIVESAKRSKAKLIAGLAAAGVLVGAAVSFIKNKVSQNAND